MLLLSKLLAKKVNLLHGIIRKNWYVNSTFGASYLSPETPLYLHYITKGSPPFQWWNPASSAECYWTRSFEQNRWTKNQLNKNLLNKKSIEQVDNWTNIWLNNYPLNKCIWTKLLQQLNKSWIEQVVTFLTWLRKLRLAECVVARQRHEARGVWGACPPF